ncbi:MAG: hypothetical protein QM840_11340, partial [Verrucomicrobiota bacterium]|nr:hypothetical protein [Verrucomicrobiota bacterium]
ELRPIYESAERVRGLVSHPWLVQQVNATAAENSAFTCQKWYYHDPLLFAELLGHYPCTPLVHGLKAG